ncbi:MAG: universal stress protein [Saonia sp.]
MKTILYATDCTENSAPALRYAYRLSSAMDARLHVMHVYTTPPISSAIILSPEKFRKRAYQEQKEIVARYCNRQLKHELYQKSVNIKVVEADSVAKRILSVSDTLRPNMVIVGMKDEHTMRGFFSGNIANELLNKIEAPLLMVPNASCYHGLSTIVYATDFEEADIFALKSLVAIAESYGALIKIVHIPLKKEVDINQRMTWFEQEVKQKISYPELVFSTPSAEDVESGLRNYIRKEQADMLVMLEREHSSIFDKLFHKDLVRTMEAEVSIPLLAFNKKGIPPKMVEPERYSYSLSLAF